MPTRPAEKDSDLPYTAGQEMMNRTTLEPEAPFMAPLTVGFATTVAMWAAGYMLRLPALTTRPGIVGTVMLLCLLVGGYIAGRTLRRGWTAGLSVGLISWVLNLLILGSLLARPDSPNHVVPSALLWLPGSLLAFVLVASVGAVFGRGTRKQEPAAQEWLPRFTCTAAAATLLLIIAGGLVTSAEQGLAVVDWPNSFGYNMFLYPLSRMTGGIYFEHAHRLLGTLVGLTTLVLALLIQSGAWPSWLKRLGWGALGLVIVQGILGGLRVTGHFTMSTDPTKVTPNIYLAITHGVVGQVFFGLLVSLSVLLSLAWHSKQRPRQSLSAGTDRGLSVTLVGLLVIQLVLGAILRHIMHGLQIHITLAVVVISIAVVTGIRAWGLYPQLTRVARAGLLLACLAGVQLVLGLAALLATGANAGTAPTDWNLVLATAHQTTGALLLALAVYLMLWLHRLVVPVTSGERA